MKTFGKVESYDNNIGTGLITPETGGKGLSFDRSAFSWSEKTAPSIGQRLAYEVAETNGVQTAVKLQHA